MKIIQEIEDYVWDGAKYSWVDTDGSPVSLEKNKELCSQSHALRQQQTMERLEQARIVFDSMSGTGERKAASLWLGETYNL